MDVPFEAFEELPPEIQKIIKATLDNQKHIIEMRNMAHESQRHKVLNFLDSLNEEQLEVFRFVVLTLKDEPSCELAGTLNGLTAHFLSEKYGYCLVCQAKHKKVEDLLEPPDLSAEENMTKYNLTLSRTGDYACSNCGHFYPSLADRMLTLPGKEGCTGCIQKEKWG